MIEGATLAPGRAAGQTVVLREPLSFWGGYDAMTGRVIDRWHPDHGRSCAGLILVMRAGRGSSSGSSVLAEAIRAGTGPAGIALAERDAILAVGALVAAELYGLACPVVAIGEAGFAQAAGATFAMIDASPGRARVVFSRP